MIVITIPGCPVTKKNSQRICVNRKTGRTFIRQSQQYEDYEQISLHEIHQQYRQDCIVSPINVKCIYYMKTKRATDLTNLMAATHDILTRAGVVEDDNSRVIASVDGSRVRYDPKNPRCEIYITDAEEE